MSLVPSALMRKVGPFPLIGWLAGGAVGLGAVLFLRRRGNSGPDQGTIQAPSPDPQSSSDLISALQDLTDSLKSSLGGKTGAAVNSGASGAPTTAVQPGATSSGLPQAQPAGAAMQSTTEAPASAASKGAGPSHVPTAPTAPPAAPPSIRGNESQGQVSVSVPGGSKLQ